MGPLTVMRSGIAGCTPQERPGRGSVIAIYGGLGVIVVGFAVSLVCYGLNRHG